MGERFIEGHLPPDIICKKHISSSFFPMSPDSPLALSFSMRCVAFRRAAGCLTACLAGAAVLRVGAVRAAECRYGPIYGWNASSLLTDSRTQDAYVSAALQWDGRFAARVRARVALALLWCLVIWSARPPSC